MGSLAVRLQFHLGHGWSCAKCQLYQGSVQSGRTFAPEPSVEVRWPFLRIQKIANSFFPRWLIVLIISDSSPEMWLDTVSAKKLKLLFGRGSKEWSSMKLAESTPVLKNLTPTPGTRSIPDPLAKGSVAGPIRINPCTFAPAWKTQNIKIPQFLPRISSDKEIILIKLSLFYL